jgi:hypothetical protein
MKALIPATHEEREIAGRALQELDENRLVVTLVPAPDPHFDGHKIRVAENRNPGWYRDFVSMAWTRARGRRGCQIKKWRVIRGLKRVYEKGLIHCRGYERKLLKQLKSVWSV